MNSAEFGNEAHFMSVLILWLLWLPETGHRALIFISEIFMVLDVVNTNFSAEIVV